MDLPARIPARRNDHLQAQSLVVDLSVHAQTKQQMGANAVSCFDHGQRRELTDIPVQHVDLVKGIVHALSIELSRFQYRLALLRDRVAHGQEFDAPSAIRREIGYLNAVLTASSADLIRVLDQLSATCDPAIQEPRLESLQRNDRACNQRQRKIRRDRVQTI